MKDSALGLSIQSQKSSGESSYALSKKRVVIGSSTSCDLRLDDSTVSPIHGILEIDEASGKVIVYDLASDTGIKVNDQTIVQAEARVGDRIQIGSFVLQVRPQSQAKKAAVVDIKPLLLESADDAQEIFDYSTEKQTCLQVVMMFVNSILEVEHFTKRKKVVIGPKENDDFGVPPLITAKGQSPGRYELVSAQGEQYLLNLHESMGGVVSRNGKMEPVRDVINQSGTTQIPLDQKDFAKVTIGDIGFFISFTPAPPRLKPQRMFAKDPFFTRVWLTSLATTLLLMVTFSNVTVSPTIEIEQLPERIATVIYKPELLPIEQPKPQVQKQPQEVAEPKEVVQEKPKKIEVKPQAPTEKPAPPNPMIGEKAEQQKKQPPKSQTKPAATPKKAAAPANRAGDEGEGARAKGENGTRGKPDAKPADTHQTKALRPGTGPKNAPANARPGNSQVQDMGVVDVFKSTGGVLNKLLAGGKGVSGAADKLEGYGGFTTQGAGGLGDAGVGSGGGGTSEGLGGLSDKGVGGGKRGKGLGALGSGGNIIGGKGKLVIAGSNGAPEPIILGAIDSDAIAREIAKHRDEIKYCYEKEINSEHPDLSGRVSVRWVIGASGSVSSAGVSSSSLKNANVENCVVDVIRRIVFPPVKGGGVAEVTYPFVFRPTKQ